MATKVGSPGSNITQGSQVQVFLDEGYAKRVNAQFTETINTANQAVASATKEGIKASVKTSANVVVGSSIDSIPYASEAIDGSLKNSVNPAVDRSFQVSADTSNKIAQKTIESSVSSSNTVYAWLKSWFV